MLSSSSKAHTWPSTIRHRHRSLSVRRFVTHTDSDPSLETHEHPAPTALPIFSPRCAARSRLEHVAKLRRRQRALRPPSPPPPSLRQPSSGWPFYTWDWFNVEEKKKPSPVSRHRLPPFLDGRWCLSVPRSRPVFLSTTVAASATDSSRLTHHHFAAHPLPYSGHPLAQPLPRRQLARFQYHV
jgi:hypothetical protein